MEGAVMKKLLLGCVALAALAAPARAADLAVKAAPAVPAFDWSGCYLGVNAGGEWTRFDNTVTTAGGNLLIPGIGLVPFAPGEIGPVASAASPVAGAQGGCRWENSSHWVIGVEADFDWTNLHGTATNDVLTTGLFRGDTFESRLRWESTARLVLGHAFDRWLVYGTGGIAFTRASMTANFMPVPAAFAGISRPGATGSGSTTLYGGTIGVGVAYALGGNWEIGAEYRNTLYQLGSVNLGSSTAFCAAPIPPGPPVCATTTVVGHLNPDVNEVTVRLNYRFR
jgi:outer membrane immunogenic protein